MFNDLCGPVRSAPGHAGASRAGAGLAETNVIDEAALLAALKAGEDWAFEALIRLHGGRLLAVARLDRQQTRAKVRERIRTAVKVRLHRARQALSTLLRRHCAPPVYVNVRRTGDLFLSTAYFV